MIDEIVIRVKYAFFRAREEGFIWFCKKITLKVIGFIMYLLLFPLNIILYFLNFRLVPILSNRIGHLSGEVDCFVKLKNLGLLDSSCKYILLRNDKIICNKVLFNYISRYFVVVENKFFVFLLNFLSIGPGIKVNISNYILSIEKNSIYYEVNKYYDGNYSIIKLTPEHLEIGFINLNKLGMDVSKKFICVHVRTNGYSIDDDLVHAHRNFNKESLYKSIIELTSRGHYCVLMGDSTAPIFPIIDMLIDYAHSDVKSDLMDVFLCSKAYFFLGNSSGLFLLSSIFNVPCALTNMLPFSATGFRKIDISIPKLIYSDEKNRFLTLGEIMNSNVSNFRNAVQFKNAKLKLISNNSVDIYYLTIEMLNLLESKLSIVELADVNKNFKKYLNKNHYSFYTESNISKSFLKSYSNILKIT